DWLGRLGLPFDRSLPNYGTRPLTRGEAAQHIWRALKLHGEWFPPREKWLQPGGDDDGDGRKDYDDPLPFDRDNNNVPDRLQPPVAKRCNRVLRAPVASLETEGVSPTLDF
ncbi:MAG: hypothetical protein WCL08_04510, partial [Verrucomicrobiota bacterium]